MSLHRSSPMRNRLLVLVLSAAAATACSSSPTAGPDRNSISAPTFDGVPADSTGLGGQGSGAGG